jgi:hypothetical protein
MPRGDRTGPAGAGPMTGRVAGYCAGNSVPGYMTGGFGMGMGMRRGAGRGLGFFGGGRGGRGVGRFGWWGLGAPYTAPTEINEKELLEGRVGALSQELDALKKRLESLDSEA